MRTASGAFAIHLLVATLIGCSSHPPEPPKTPSSGAELDAKSVDEVQVAEEMRAEDVLFALGGSEDEFRKCFMRAMQERGIVKTRFQLGERGEVVRAEVVRSTLGRQDVAACIVERLSSQVFGPQDGAKSGSWTFVFRLSDPVKPHNFKAKLRSAKQKKPADGVVVDPASRGNLPITSIEDRIEVKYPLFARCYRSSIDRRGRSEGILRLVFEVDQDGRVQDVQDEGSVMPDPYAVDCIAEGFYAMEFPAPTGGPIRVHYRLDFE
jgi:hypothetical protein